MKTKIAFTMMLVLLVAACSGQEKQRDKSEEVQRAMKEPKERTEVHREYDEFGNLIEYDSTYLWSYSNMAGDSIRVNLDSVMDAFRSHFENQIPYLGMQGFRYFPKHDSLLMNDFFDEDYYFKNWEDSHDDFEKMMHRMDSMRNSFLEELYPGLLESQKKGPE